MNHLSFHNADDGIDSLDVLAYGMTGGNALNDYTGNRRFSFYDRDWLG